MRDEVIQSVKHILKENPTIDDSQLEKDAKNIFLLLTYGVIFGVLRKVAFSIGSKEIEEAYDVLLEDKNTPAVRLINQAIKLQFMKQLDHSTIKDLVT
ncbi:hypothetical protein P4E94_19880, partial [Pontiellaceae bacterium B12219]|nr:hypothetical protein [Pontiellaceae bacterium B12219]